MILSPVMAKSFNLLYTAVREGTSFTKQDIAEFRRLAAKGEAVGEKWQHNPKLQAQMNAEWEALAEKWRQRLENSLSPDTRQGLEAALTTFNALVEDEAKKKKKEAAENDDDDDDDKETAQRKL